MANTVRYLHWLGETVVGEADGSVGTDRYRATHVRAGGQHLNQPHKLVQAVATAAPAPASRDSRRRQSLLAQGNCPSEMDAMLASRPRTPYPRARTDDIRPGAYLLEPGDGQLLYVLALRVAERERGEKVRVAILEDAWTANVEPWDFPEITAILHVVRPAT